MHNPSRRRRVEVDPTLKLCEELLLIFFPDFLRLLFGNGLRLWRMRSGERSRPDEFESSSCTFSRLISDLISPLDLPRGVVCTLCKMTMDRSYVVMPKKESAAYNFDDMHGRNLNARRRCVQPTRLDATWRLGFACTDASLSAVRGHCTRALAKRGKRLERPTNERRSSNAHRVIEIVFRAGIRRIAL